MLDDKRLQEIKDIVGNDIGGMINKRFARELIAALEACQQELTESYPPPMRLSHEKAKDSETIRDLRKQLAKANEWRGTWKDRCLFGIAKLRERKKELAEARAELAEAKDVRDGWKDYSILYKSYAKKWSKDNADLRKQLAEAQETIKFRAWRDG